MKKIIITRSQLNEVMDNQKTIVSFKGSNANEMGQNAQEKYNDALKSGLKSNAISLKGTSTGNNAADNEETPIAFDTNTSTSIKDSVTNAVQNAVNNGADINKISVQGNTEDVTNGLGESKTYSKKNVELARLHEIKKNSKIYTKKTLFEDAESDKNIIWNSKLYDVTEAFRKTFGDWELQKGANQMNLIGFIINKYLDSSPNQQKEFMERLKGTYADEPIDLEIDF